MAAPLFRRALSTPIGVPLPEGGRAQTERLFSPASLSSSVEALRPRPRPQVKPLPPGGRARAGRAPVLRAILAPARA